MKRFLLMFSIIFTSAAGHYLCAQEEAVRDTAPENVLLEKQWSVGGMIHTNGWGIKFRKGHNIVALRQFMWEVEISSYKSPKEVRTVNPMFPDSRSYFYGKLNYVWFLRGGIGQQRILNRKPYWGGIQLSWVYYGGFSLGITKPVYLYIYHPISFITGEYTVTEEKYDPEIHFTDNIYGRGSFLAGFSQIAFHPGAYVKTGLEFEFGVKSRQINALEVGAILDASPLPIAIMAYNPKQNFFVTLYVSVMFGKRYNKY